MGLFDGWFDSGSSNPATPWTPTADDPGMPIDEGWGFGPTDNPDRASFKEGYLDQTSRFDTPASSGGNLGKIGGALKDLSGDVKKLGEGQQTPQQRQMQLQQEIARTQGGALTQLLQLLQQRQQDFWTAAHKGAAPVGTTPGTGGLFGV